MPANPHQLLLPYLGASLLAVLLLTGLWYSIGRSVVLPDAATSTHKLQCASYSPFDHDQSPFDRPLRLRPERIDADLAQLATRFQCVRTYSMLGLEAVPALARKHDLKLMLGAWVSADPVATSAEIERLIDSANANPGVVTGVIVGNEALLRKEVTGAQLVALIEQVKGRVSQPVTYADVWEFWQRYPQVAAAVDFLTIHLLPYWEDQPTGIDAALAHVASIREDFGSTFAPKDILIGETGWPSEGRQRDTAVPSRINQAKFIRGFVTMAEKNGWHYNLIEAYDQPWKRESEGVVGGYWGLFDTYRQDKNVLTGPVSNLPHWPAWWAVSVLLGMAGLGLAGRPASRRAAMLLPLTAALGAACGALWSEQALIGSRAGEWLWAALLLGLNLLVLAHALLGLSCHLGVRQAVFDWLQARAGWWLLASGFAGAVLMLELVFDARYRGFPSVALLLPALVYLLRPVHAPRRESAMLAALIGIGIPLQLYQEGLDNQQALGWALVSGLLVAGLWRSRRHSATDYPLR